MTALIPKFYCYYYYSVQYNSVLFHFETVASLLYWMCSTKGRMNWLQQWEVSHSGFGSGLFAAAIAQRGGANREQLIGLQ